MTYLIVLAIIALSLSASLLTSLGARVTEFISDKKMDPDRGSATPATFAIATVAALSTHPDLPPIRGSVLVGYLLIATFFCGFLTWMGTASLQSAAVAQGSVNLDTYRKTVQHLEGGIIQKIFIREGQDVVKNEVLFQVDETQAKSRIDMLEAQILSGEKQLKLITDELAGIEGLFQKGLTTQTRLLSLKRRKVELEGDRTEKMAQLRAARDRIRRSKIRAPISGTIVSLQVHTPGGVIKPGASLLSIVPQDEPLVVEAKIEPNDIDVVHKGQHVQVRLTPLNARMVPPLPGRIVWISADKVYDENADRSYYLARIKIAAKTIDLHEGVDLYPGMPAEVMIATGERTFLEYLVAPISRSFRRAFREQ